ncbi:MAG: hypothetical protein LKE40_00055 [Spirochaetia bacterium]|jgi:hypothetical protein|nr:hypothetical protein [Spirochaetia bacterium]
MGKNFTKGFCPLCNYKSLLAQTSLNTASMESLLDSGTEVYDFDKLAETLSGLRGDEALNSCDAYFEKDDKIYLFEFKDQPRCNIPNKVIQQKAFDSVAQLLMSWKNGDSQQIVSSKLVLFVIFNSEKERSYEKTSKKIYTMAYPHSQEEPCYFGLDSSMLKEYFVRIHTISIDCFIEKIYAVDF